MCGIAAVVWPGEPEPEVAREALRRMLARLHHRGPDGVGLIPARGGHAVIGNTRLAIRDLTPAGALPFSIADGRLSIAYNGEVYNAAELRAELEGAGHVFRSDNDAEVVLRAYQQWGESMPGRLRGMFAFVIQDERAAQARFFIARDPLGIKPLYYAESARALVIASELNALRASGLVECTIDPVSLQGYLLLGSVPAPRTIYTQARALPPGHFASFGAGEPVSALAYWRFPEEEASAPAAPADTLSRIEDAVRSHLVSDVPLGAFLSGGLDSSLVVALMARTSGTAVRTCSLTFAEREFDESNFARIIARTFATDHYERPITRTELSHGLEAAFAAIDQPSIDGLNTYFVSRVAREAGLKVVLSGLGGDELFGGYDNTFRGVPRLLRIQRLSRSIPGGPRLAGSLVSQLATQQRWLKVAEALARGPAPAAAYLAFRGLFTAAEVSALLPAAGGFDAAGYIEAQAGAPALNSSAAVKSWVSRAELRSYTLNQLLRDTDVMSMAHSLEVRVPLLDTRLVEHTLALPPAERFRGTGRKPLLRRIAATLLPREIVERRDKQGFVLPYNRWLRQQASADLMEWRGGVFDAFDQAELSRLRADFQAGRAHWSRVWALSALQAWQTQVQRS